MFVSSVPNFVEPVTKSTDEVIVCTTNVCAVIVLFTSRLDAVAFCLITKLSAELAVAAVIAFKAQLAVPNRLPVIPADTLRDPVTNALPLTSNLPFKLASLPIPTADCDTKNALCPYWPIRTVLSEKASMIGRPAAVLTLNKDPESVSSTWNRRPTVPSIEKRAEPLPRRDAATVDPDW